MSVTIYGIKNCDTMKKARAWLDGHDVAYTFHDYKASGIERSKLEAWAKDVGWEVLLNRAGTTFRALPEKDKEALSEKKAVALMMAQPSMIKRPGARCRWQAARRLQAGPVWRSVQSMIPPDSRPPLMSGLLFVYGTLMREHSMHRQIAAHADYVDDATFNGRLYRVQRIIPALWILSLRKTLFTASFTACTNPRLSWNSMTMKAADQARRSRLSMSGCKDPLCAPTEQSSPPWIYLYNHPVRTPAADPVGQVHAAVIPRTEVSMQIDLSSRTAIVTGGSKGIGLGVATRFAASGANVVIAGRGRAALDEAVASIGKVAKGKVVAAQGDVAVADDVKRIYDEGMKAFGKIDIVVNNAGTSRAGPFENLTDEILQADLEQKLFAAVRLTRLVWPQMKERKWGRVINVLNIGAKSPRANSHRRRFRAPPAWR